MLLEQLKAILSNLYAQYGLTEDILMLSQLIDKLIKQEQKRKALRIENMKYLEECYKKYGGNLYE